MTEEMTPAHASMQADYLLAARIAKGYLPDSCPSMTMPLSGLLYAQAQARIAEIEEMDKHLPENVARLLIDYYLCDWLGVKTAPGVTLEKQGEGSGVSHSWAFWIEEDDTTSYLHEDGRIEFRGTVWEPAALRDKAMQTQAAIQK